jgi:hypothetical protein
MSLFRRAGGRLSALMGPAVEDVLKLAPQTFKNLDLVSTNARLLQMLLARSYASIRDGKSAPLPLVETEFRAYSQNGEDGLLLYIFSLIGTTSRRAVEICAGSGIECNTANLIIHHGWTALLVDGDNGNILRGKSFYRRCRDTFSYPPTLVHAWITAENVNQILLKHGFDGEIDLLSLDLDGMDYWIWKAIEVVRPRVVTIEFNSVLGSERSLTVPYSATFRAGEHGDHDKFYSGASLAALVKLGKEKGYRLIGSERLGVNAFFVRREIPDNLLEEVPLEHCFRHPRAAVAATYFSRVSSRDWLDV